MKKRDLLRELSKIATAKGESFTLGRQGKHEIWIFGSTSIPIPRHTEIDEQLAKSIIRRAESL